MDCETLQLLLVEGHPLPEGAEAHLRGCEACRFVASLPTQLGSAPQGPLGGAIEDLDRALASREPLLGRWRLEERRGRGGQGVVYRATDLETGETVALKAVRGSGGEAGLAEVVHMRRVRHPNVCRVFHTERLGALRLILMEYVDGPALSALPPLAPSAARALFRGIADGVQAAHEVGILHLDLKPSNVLLRHGEPVVTDFGLSRSAATDGPQAGGGTPRYMAPEQRAGGPVDVRADVYALGRLLHDLSGGARWARRAVDRATRVDPAERPPDVAALLRLLGGAREGAWTPTSAGAAGGAAALLLLGAAALALPLVLPRPTPPRPEWRESWGFDLVPREAWNVALNLDGAGLPSLSLSHPPWGCAQQPWDLLDGQVRYDRWEHGVAFAPAPTVAQPDYACVPLDWAFRCGGLSPDDRLCRIHGRGYTVLDQRARDRERVQGEGPLGRADPKLDCGERAVTVDLGRARNVVAVRTWHHNPENAPSSYRVEVWDEAGELRVFGTANNSMARTSAWFSDPPGPDRRPRNHMSGPITTLIAPTQTRRVRFVMDTCTTLDPEALRRYRDRDAHPERVGAAPSPGWLYEVEVFARLSPYEAWWSWITRD